MGEPLFGVVPNFSEGRRSDVVDAIVAALAVPGARVLYAEADPAHHRLDTTVLGSRDAVWASAMAGARVAVALIDLTTHRGGHPRMGAVDVIPFMPVRGAAMDDCVGLARAFGAELARELDLPVYLYERAALMEERRSLADVRRGQFEGLREDVAQGRRLPDFGPHALGPAGATAVGARPPLVAFNCYLDGTDEDVARAIAGEVRESGGGPPAVRAIGFVVPERGCVTVSMNLVDHEVTGIGTAFDAVAAAAARRGLVVTSSEIVGLAPEAAVRPDDVDRVRLEGFDPARQVLERLVGEDGV
jgi:glutamate formiminotransferase